MISPSLTEMEPSVFGKKYHLYYLNGINISSSRLLSSMWISISRTAIMAYLASYMQRAQPLHISNSTRHRQQGNML